jgi:transcriptional regulator with XRE-family HTH domain
MSQLGTILRNRREELNLTQAEVSRQTNIRVNIIDALEKGKNSILPPTYLRSFSKSYWQFLKLPMEDFEKSFADSGIMPQVQEQSFIGTLINPEKEKEKEYTPPPPLKTIEAPRYSPRLVSGVISAAMILILVIGVYYLFVKDIVDDTPVEPGTQSEVTTKSSGSSNESGGELLSIFEDEPSKDSIILEVTARNNTWFTINADGKKSEEVLLASGQSGRWTAVEYFILSISNNGGAIFKRNGQTLDNIGKEGTIIREMKITANEMLTSAMPYSDSDGNADQKKAVEKPKTDPVKQSPTKPIEKNVKPKSTTTAAVKKPASTTSKPKTNGTDVVKPKKKTSETTTPTKKKSETITKKKTETTKKKSTNEKNKAITKKKVSEKSKAGDKKKKSTTTSKSKETKKTAPKKPITEKKKSSESNKVETPKTIPIANPRR